MYQDSMSNVIMTLTTCSHPRAPMVVIRNLSGLTDAFAHHWESLFARLNFFSVGEKLIVSIQPTFYSEVAPLAC